MPTGHKAGKKFPLFLFLALTIFAAAFVIVLSLTRDSVSDEMREKAATVLSVVNERNRQTLIKELGGAAPADTILDDITCTTAKLGDIDADDDDFFTFHIYCDTPSSEVIVYMSRSSDGSWLAHVP